MSPELNEIASIVELPQTLFLARSIGASTNLYLIHRALVECHLLAIWFGQYVLLLFNPGPRSGPTPSSNALAWFSVFIFQTLATAPFIYGLLKWLGLSKSKESLE